MTSVPEDVQAAVIERAGRRCEYCHAPDRLQIGGFEVDHIVPKSNGGQTILAYACPECNGHKWAHEQGRDPETGEDAPIFNPRTDIWEEHFTWLMLPKSEFHIDGKTPCGRATTLRLQMNSPEMVTIRNELVTRGVLVNPEVDT